MGATLVALDTSWYIHDSPSGFAPAMGQMAQAQTLAAFRAFFPQFYPIVIELLQVPKHNYHNHNHNYNHKHNDNYNHNLNHNELPPAPIHAEKAPPFFNLIPFYLFAFIRIFLIFFYSLDFVLSYIWSYISLPIWQETNTTDCHLH